MKQLTLWGRPEPRGPSAAAAASKRPSPAAPLAVCGGGGVQALIKLLSEESELMFVAVLPHGSVLKCISELLHRCSLYVPLVATSEGLRLTSCDSASGRLIQVVLRAADILHYECMGAGELRVTLDASSLHAVMHQLKRRDQVVLYGTRAGQVGSLVDYSDTQSHTKHSSITTKGVGCCDYLLPAGYQTVGVPVPSGILQRILREYKNLSKRIIITGNGSYIHIQTDARFSLHRSDNLFSSSPGTLLEATMLPYDVTVELGIATLSRIQKITQFDATVSITCEPGLPIRLTAHLGLHGSRIDVFLEQEQQAPPPSSLCSE